MGKDIVNDQIYWKVYSDFKKQNYNIGQIAGLEYYNRSAWISAATTHQPKLDIYYSFDSIKDGSDTIISTSSKNVFVRFSFCWADLALAFKGFNFYTPTDPFSHKPYYAGNYGDFNTLMTTPITMSDPNTSLLRSEINFRIELPGSGGTRYLTVFDYNLDPLNCIVSARGELLTSRTKY